MIYLGQLDPMPKQPVTTPTVSMAAGTGGGDPLAIATGVSAMLTPFAQFFLMEQQRKAEERLAKLQSQQQPVFVPQPAGNQNMIILIAAGAVVLVLIIVLLGGSKGSSGVEGAPSIGGAPIAPGYTKIVRRVKRRPKKRSR